MAHLERTIDAVRQRTPDTAVTVAASGPRMLALAGRTADVVALGASPYADERELARLAGIVTQAAAGRQVELNVNLSAVGDDIPPWLEKRMGVTVEKLVAAGSFAHLRGTPQEMADTLQRRRAATGISSICAGVDNAERLAPVVELLHGR
jgi:alkanesulfonate monooxygenase SsuD/methylene tetrahydromethanopterin reductase-like flavin-dependent oxidoreductase (luciferase family)